MTEVVKETHNLSKKEPHKNKKKVLLVSPPGLQGCFEIDIALDSVPKIQRKASPLAATGQRIPNNPRNEVIASSSRAGQPMILESPSHVSDSKSFNEAHSADFSFDFDDDDPESTRLFHEVLNKRNRKLLRKLMATRGSGS